MGLRGIAGRRSRFPQDMIYIDNVMDIKLLYNIKLKI